MQTQVIITQIIIPAVVVLIEAMLVLSNVGGLLKKKNLYLVSFNRLILGPAFLITIFNLIAALTGLAPESW
jgi:hypothetical protein